MRWRRGRRRSMRQRRPGFSLGSKPGHCYVTPLAEGHTQRAAGSDTGSPSPGAVVWEPVRLTTRSARRTGFAAGKGEIAAWAELAPAIAELAAVGAAPEGKVVEMRAPHARQEAETALLAVVKALIEWLHGIRI